MNSRAPRLSADQWQQLISQFEQSSDVPEDFCRRHKLALSTFNKWRRRFTLAATPTLPAFIEAIDPPASAPSITLRLGEQLQVDLPLTLGVDRIAELTQAIVSRVRG